MSAKKHAAETALPPGFETFRVRHSAGHLLRRAHQVAVALYAETVAGALSPRQFSILTTLHQEPGLLQVHLSDRIGADRSTVSELIARLEKHGLIRRRRLPGDDRIAELFITEAGVAALAEAAPGALLMHDRIMALLPAELREPFHQALICIAEGSHWNRGKMVPAAAGAGSQPARATNRPPASKSSSRRRNSTAEKSRPESDGTD